MCTPCISTTTRRSPAAARSGASPRSSRRRSSPTRTRRWSAPCTTAGALRQRHHGLQAPRARPRRRSLKALAKPDFMIKIIPHVDCTPRICELVRYYMEDVTLKGAWAGPAALQLFDHALCDVDRLPVREVVSASHYRRRPDAGSRRGRATTISPEHVISSALRKDRHMSRFKGRIAIVTGAASGIGKEIALRLAAEGAIARHRRSQPRRGAARRPRRSRPRAATPSPSP